MYNHSKPEIEIQSFSSIIAFLSAREYVNVSDCFSATLRGVAKIYSELVALRLLTLYSAAHN